MSGYDFKYISSLNLMAQRLYGTAVRDGDPSYVSVDTSEAGIDNLTDSAITGIRGQATQLNYNGGFKQQERMICDKRRSLDKALIYSYQGANILKVVDGKTTYPVRALINSNKLKMDYDDKILSVGYEFGFQPGDVFEWMGTNTYWIIYLQDLTELAYFRGDIRKCSHTICYTDENGTHSTYAAIRGPVETKINSIQKYGISVDNPNYSLNILLPKTKENLEYFRRYSKFYFENIEDGAPDICWRVEAVNWISMPGVIEIVAVEYYSNQMEEKQKLEDAGHIQAFALRAVPEDKGEQIINGESTIRPKKEYKYEASSITKKEWSVLEGVPVKLRIDSENPKICYITWVSGFSGQFDLYFGKTKKHITVGSLF